MCSLGSGNSQHRQRPASATAGNGQPIRDSVTALSRIQAGVQAWPRAMLGRQQDMLGAASI